MPVKLYFDWRAGSHRLMSQWMSVWYILCLHLEFPSRCLGHYLNTVPEYRLIDTNWLAVKQIEQPVIYCLDSLWAWHMPMTWQIQKHFTHNQKNQDEKSLGQMMNTALWQYFIAVAMWLWDCQVCLWLSVIDNRTLICASMVLVCNYKPAGPHLEINRLAAGLDVTLNLKINQIFSPSVLRIQH